MLNLSCDLVAVEIGVNKTQQTDDVIKNTGSNNDWLKNPGTLGKVAHGYAKRCFLSIFKIWSVVLPQVWDCNHVSWFGTAVYLRSGTAPNFLIKL